MSKQQKILSLSCTGGQLAIKEGYILSCLYPNSWGLSKNVFFFWLYCWQLHITKATRSCPPKQLGTQHKYLFSLSCTGWQLAINEGYTELPTQTVGDSTKLFFFLLAVPAGNWRLTKATQSCPPKLLGTF
jgi:hypothetical protein